MLKKIFKPLTTLESMISLIGYVNTFFGLFAIADMSLLIRIIMLITGLISIMYIIYSSMQRQKVSNFITNNEHRYKMQRKIPINDVADKKQWMFYALAEKLPSLSCKKLKKLIDKHYEFIGDSK